MADGKSLAMKSGRDSEILIRPHLTTHFAVQRHLLMQNQIVETTVYCGNILALDFGSYVRRLVLRDESMQCSIVGTTV